VLYHYLESRIRRSLRSPIIINSIANFHPRETGDERVMKSCRNLVDFKCTSHLSSLSSAASHLCICHAPSSNEREAILAFIAGSCQVAAVSDAVLRRHQCELRQSIDFREDGAKLQVYMGNLYFLSGGKILSRCLVAVC